MEVTIVGAGIAGLSLALYLGRDGHQVTVLDQAPEPLPVGAGFLLQPPGQAVLDDLGLLAGVSGHSATIDRLHSMSNQGRTLLDLDYRKLPGGDRRGMGVERSTIFDALHNACLTQDISLNWSQSVDDLSHIPADLLVVATGTSTSFDHPELPKRIRRPYEWGCYWTTIDLPDALEATTLHQRCDTSRFMMGILPTGENRAALYWSLKQSDMAYMSPADFKTQKQLMKDFWPEAEDSVDKMSQQDFACARYYDLWSRPPASDRIIAIGDYAHATSPQLGQGCTMALLDARLLARLISENGGTYDATIGNALWKGRKKQLAWVRHISRFLTPLYQSDARLPWMIRNWIVSPAGTLPFVNRLQLKTLASDVFLNQISRPAP